MKSLFYFLSMLAVGLALGLVGFHWASDHAISSTGIENGPWRTNTAYGDPDADPFLKSGVARRGLLALKKSETIYYTAFTDSNGETLRDTCTYHVAGPAPATRWWSFTLYGEDDYLIANEPGIYSVFMNPQVPGVDFIISPEQPATGGDWLPSSGGGNVSVTLRLYNPSAETYDSLATTPLPIITRESCA